LGSCSLARVLSKCVTISGPKFISFEKVGFSDFRPHRHISTVFELWPTKCWGHVALCPRAFQKCHHKWTKVHPFRESGGFPIFAPIAISPLFLNFGPQNFCRHVALPKVFPQVSPYVDQSSSLSRKWGFSGFRPHRHISAVFELWPTKFWGLVALPRAFQKCHHKWTKVHHFQKSGGFPVFAPIALSPQYLNFGRLTFTLCSYKQPKFI